MKDAKNGKTIGRQRLALALGVVMLFLAGRLAPAQDEIERELDDASGGEEWYGPSDWWSGEDLERDGRAFSDYGSGDAEWEGHRWHGDPSYIDRYGPEYLLNPVTGKWVASYGSDRRIQAGYDFTEIIGPQDVQNGGQGQRASGQDASRTLEGSIEGFRRIDLSSPTGDDTAHILARVSSAGGETAVVDFGPAAQLDKSITVGDQVTLKGSQGSLDGRKVFVASELSAHGQTFAIKRQQSREPVADPFSEMARHKGSDDEREQAQPSDEGRDLLLEGEISEMETLRIEGEEESHRFIKLRLQGGESVTVQLGPEDSLADLDLEKGDHVRIIGSEGRIDGRKVIAARSISVEGS